MRRLTQGTERCGRGALRATALLTLSIALLGAGTASAADFNPAPGAYTADTTTLKITGPGPTNITGLNQGGVAVFSFDDVNIGGGVTITASGSRPLKIVASGSLTMAGTINASGTSTSADFAVGPFAGGPGGGAGGTTGGDHGVGPGGGGAQPTDNDGGGGGGFGGKGARGGKNGVDGATTGIAPAGPAYGNLNGGPLQGGSGGAGGSGTGGGGGGGGVALFGDFVTITGVVFADGGAGATGGNGASAGGSGGGIVVHGDTVDVSGALVARGGAGGAGGCCGDGGGGGGGRIAYQYRTLAASGSTFITGGTSGTRSTSGLTSGGASADASGAVGVVTKRQAATATTSPATGISATGATLNGTINPHLNATSFHFDFGTTTAYGSRAPVPDGGAGADNANHAVAVGVGGLAPSTTYHYRLVATDSAGFTTFGTDIGFTTPAAPPPPPPPPPGGGGGGGLTVIPSTTSINSLAFVKFTKLVNLSVKNLLAGSTVTVTCKTKKKKQQKKGCPYKRKRFTTSGARAKLNLRKPFKKKRVPVGTKITITIAARGFIGKQIQYTIRKRKIPKSRVLCVAPGSRPSSCR